MEINNDEFDRLTEWCNDVLSDKSENTLAQWVADYGGRINEHTYLEFGSYCALPAMLARRDKEVVRRVLQTLVITK